MKRDYDEVLSEYGISAYDETSQGEAMTQREELSDDKKKLNWLLGLEKETLADMAHQQSKIIEKLQKVAKTQAVPQWIPVSERLPEHKDGMWSDPVIAMSDTGDVFRLSYCGGWQRTSSFMDSGSSNVTHWMPLPAAPEQNK